MSMGTGETVNDRGSIPTATTSLGYARWRRLCKKELLETLRDRRTLGTLLVMPLLVYPLLSMALNRFVLSAGVTTSAYRVGVPSEEQGNLIKPILDPQSNPPPPAVREVFQDQIASFELFVVDSRTNETAIGDEPTSALLRGDIDVWINNVNAPERRDSTDWQPDGSLRQIQIVTREGDPNGQAARQILLSRLQWWEIKQFGGSRIAVDVVTVGEPSQSSVLASIIPLVLVLMTITGAVYPAIDLTAGERERGTMEALMASPVQPFALLTAKYVAVIAVAMLTAIVNLAAMFITLSVSGLLQTITGQDGLALFTATAIIALLGLFATFFAAVLLSLTSYARSFKEAQAYLIPVMLLSITPAMISLLPGVSLAGALAVVPLINMVLLTQAVLEGNIPPVEATLVVLSTMGYAAAALAVAAKLFGTEAVTRSGGVSVAATFRRPVQPRDRPTPAMAAFVVAMLIPIYFVGSSVLIRQVGRRSSELTNGGSENIVGQIGLQITSMTWSAAALAVIFGGVPLLVALAGRCRLRTTYRIESFATVTLAATLLIGCGAWTMAHEAFVLFANVLGGLDVDRITRMQSMLEAWTMIPPWIILVCLALTPAIVEELCFRGFLFSALRDVLTPWKTILVTSVLFGLFHVLTGNALLVERFVPTTLLGLLIGWVAYRTGSVVPGMVLHFAHNALLTMVGHYHRRITWFGTDFDNQTHLPLPWLIGGVTCVAAGMVVIRLLTQKTTKIP